MIIVHHLENSRSHRVIWLLEELGLDYEVKAYYRNPKTSLAPDSLYAVHPLGKSPVLEHDGRIIAETGAIVDYVIEYLADGRLGPPRDQDAALDYRYWIHASEGTYMPGIVMELFMSKIETTPMPFFAKPIAKRIAQGVRDSYLTHTRKAQYEFLNATLAERDWLTGPEFTAADIMMSFPVEAAGNRSELMRGLKHIRRFGEACSARPAYQRALERGGPYAYAA